MGRFAKGRPIAVRGDYKSVELRCPGYTLDTGQTSTRERAFAPYQQPELSRWPI